MFPKKSFPPARMVWIFSAEIARTVSKMPGDRVRVTQGMAGPLPLATGLPPSAGIRAEQKPDCGVVAGHVSRSPERFLRVSGRRMASSIVTDLTLDRVGRTNHDSKTKESRPRGISCGRFCFLPRQSRNHGAGSKATLAQTGRSESGC